MLTLESFRMYTYIKLRGQNAAQWKNPRFNPQVHKQKQNKRTQNKKTIISYSINIIFIYQSYLNKAGEKPL